MRMDDEYLVCGLKIYYIKESGVDLPRVSEWIHIGDGGGRVLVQRVLTHRQFLSSRVISTGNFSLTDDISTRHHQRKQSHLKPVIYPGPAYPQTLESFSLLNDLPTDRYPAK
jgi:hypothetical protein